MFSRVVTSRPPRGVCASTTNQISSSVVQCRNFGVRRRYKAPPSKPARDKPTTRKEKRRAKAGIKSFNPNIVDDDDLDMESDDPFETTVKISDEEKFWYTIMQRVPLTPVIPADKQEYADKLDKTYNSLVQKKVKLAKADLALKIYHKESAINAMPKRFQEAARREDWSRMPNVKEGAIMVSEWVPPKYPLVDYDG